MRKNDFKVVFKNQIDIQVFTKDFYQLFLENIIKIKTQKVSKNNNLSTPNVDTSKIQNGIMACACLDTSRTCLSQAKSKRKHVLVKSKIN